MRKILSFLLIALISTLTSCSVHNLSKPEVTLVNLEVGEVSLLETELLVTLRIDNENSTELTIDGGVHKISLNGIKAGKALSNERIEIPRLGSTSQTLKARIDNLSLITRIRELIESQDFQYRIDSTFYVKRAYGTRSVKASRSGRFGLGQLS